MRLSVLDQSPVSVGMEPAQALLNSIDLGRRADEWGYHRLWIAEHHGTDALASPAPEILIARIGGETSRIRVGSGGVMLPHYSPLKVAEVFRMLHALTPGRVDLGVGRAPGGTPLETFALRRERLDTPQPDDFGEQLVELLAFLNGEFAPRHPFSRVKISPQAPGSPDLWLLGSSMWSAAAAAQLGLPYAFAHFISPEPTRAAIEHYRANFRPSRYLDAPRAIVSLGAICADTDAAAERLSASARLVRRRLSRGELRPIPSVEESLRELGESPSQGDIESEWPRYFIGSPQSLRAGLAALADALQLEEIMIVTIVHDHAARLRSYELLARAFALQG